MRIVTAGCQLLYLERGGHREERLQANGLAKSVNIEKGGPKNSSIHHEKSGYIGVMPVWDLPEGDEMGTRPGVRSLTRTRDKATAYLEMCVRPHKAKVRFLF